MTVDRPIVRSCKIVSMLKIAFDPIYAHPLPEGHRFPMIKYELIPAQLLHEGVIRPENLFSPERATDESVLLTHDAVYWKQLKEGNLSAAEQRRIGFPWSASLVERERRIAQGTMDASLFAMEYGVAFNVAGGTHHAGSNWGEGFCMLNDQAMAANFILHKKLVSKILIIDLDVHQGNGTAEIFADDDRVFTFSMHGANNFPSRKQISDLDLPLPDGMEDEAYLKILRDTLPPLIENQQPEFIFYLAGVDVLATDQLGKISLTAAGCQERDEFIFNLCHAKGIPVQVSMGGGYSPHIRDIVNAHCKTFQSANDLYF